MTDLGFPPLGIFNMSQFGSSMLELFARKEHLLNSTETTFVSAIDRQIIYCVVSAANNCEMCLSFHASGLLQAEHLPVSDVDALLEGALPADANARKLAIATKYAIAHKGILLAREKAHLEALGVSQDMYAEVLFWAGQIHANNMLMVYLINEGAPVEEMLQGIGPFKNTVYKK